MYIFMITCYALMFINLIDLILVGTSGFFDHSIFGASHTRFSLFMILVFTITETVVMFFFIATGKAIKEAIENGLGEKNLWLRERKLKMQLFPQLMLTITLVGGWVIHIGAVENQMATAPYHGIFFAIAFLHHLWTLKLKNNAFREQLNIIEQLKPIEITNLN